MFRRRLPRAALFAVGLGLIAVALASILISSRGEMLAGGSPPQTGGEGGSLATPEPAWPTPEPPAPARPTPARREPNAGADITSVVDPEDTASQVPLPVPTDNAGEQRYAVLLLGYGGGGHDGAYLTDSLMVVIVDPAAKTLTLLSLPRDSWVPLVFSPKSVVHNKVNTAYAFAQDDTQFPDRLARYQGPQGPGNFAMDTVARLLGIPITYYLGLDFQGFRQMIDAVGGIDVVVPASFSAQYPRNDDPSVDAGWMVVRFTQGPEHMDGERAIRFARAREALDNLDEGTDFARSRRQRLVMQAFKDRLFQPGGLVHLPELLGIAVQHVDTNYTVPDAAKLAQLAPAWQDVTIYQTALTTANYLENATGPEGAYIVVPDGPDHSWAQIRAFARQLWQDPAAGVAMADTTIVVENDSGIAGLAGRVSTALLKLGYRVDDPISGPYRAHTQLVDQTRGKATALVGRLEHDLGIPQLDVTQSSTDQPSPTAANELTLQLGADQASLAITVPDDSTAPLSTVGVVKFGVWPYTPSPPTPTPLRSAPRTTPPTPIPAAAGASQVTVPSMIGLSEAEARRALEAAGLTTTYVNYQTTNDVADHRYFLSIAPGHVLSQSIQPGTTVPRGTKVLLAVRKE